MFNLSLALYNFPLEILLIFIILVSGISILALSAILLAFFITNHLPFNYQKHIPSHALITGGSKGLGLAIAKELAYFGSNITIVSRGQDALDKAILEIKSYLPPNSTQIIQGYSADASDYDSVYKLIQKCHSSPAGRPSWIIANAGSSVPGFLADDLPSANSIGSIKHQINSNYITAGNVVQATLAFARKDSTDPHKISGIEADGLSSLPDRIIIVGSVLSLMSFIGYSAYSASKYALKGLCDGLRSELISTHCKVHLYAPANMDTPGFANESLTKPTITAKIEGQASTVTSKQAAISLISGVLYNRYVISNDLLGELVRVVVNGAAPRPNAIIEVLAIPLLAAIFTFWTKSRHLTKSIKTTKTDIPEGLLEEIKGIDSSGDSRFKLLSKNHSNRKALRKNKKIEKKQNRFIHHSSLEKKNALNISKVSSKVAKKEIIRNVEIPIQKPISEKMKLKKLQESNPNFYKLLVDSNVINDGSGKTGTIDNEVQHYASLLKLKKGKISKEFENDGLDELLGDLKEESDDQMSLINDDDSDLENFNDMEMDMENDNDIDMESHDSESEKSQDLSVSFDENNLETDSDIDTEAKETPIETKAQNRYVPPHLRKIDVESETRIRMLRQIKGLVNRISDANLETTLSDIELIYRDNSRHDSTDILTDVILQMVGDSAMLIDSFVQTYAAFSTCVYHMIGLDFGSHLIEKCVHMIENDQHTKRKGNLLTLLGYLYNFGVLTSAMIYDYVRILITQLQEEDVEVLLRLLRICGQQMRSDDPSSLKDIIVLLKDEMGKRDEATLTTRIQYMAESINDLKNNKHKKKPVNEGTQQERLKKFITNLTRKKLLNGTEPLRIRIQDIQDIPTKGKWWLVGSAWAGRETNPQESPKAIQVETSNDLLVLAKSQKMNTDIRRSIFVVLMSSEDYADAFERLLKLGLKDKQEREIVRVIIHCCSKEKIFNPYYSYISQKFCDHSYSFQITFQYALWDIIKASSHDSEEYSGKEGVRRMSYIAQLYLHLFTTKSLSISVLKTMHFTSLSPIQVLFCQITIGNLLLISNMGSKSDKLVCDIFSRAKEANDEFREGILFFIKQYISTSCSSILGLKSIDKTFLKARSSLIKSILL